ncbi:hypothetical protein P43SY_005512 [Pythium insidiosum]|uniref:Uncharacterized protein n=1 Tax=Pythium insidiosum TaxID=114742 RepID=A0AAD5QD89_PYTIN|nr:hypothetical protein P43SY_005512 [Pythium insidiosum]KAJ0410626.1 hypothetical protein ATCC90586_009107 [Pythium insidiosum]
MPPPRSIRVAAAAELSEEATPPEVLDAMRAYAEAHQVRAMLQVMLTKLLEAQPLDPFEFLIQVVRQDEELDALERDAKINRFDLRRESTKRQLVVAFFKRLMALQRTQHPDKLVALGTELATPFLLKQLRLDETREHLRQQFPKHYRDLIHRFLEREKSLPSSLSMTDFTASCMQLLQGMGGAAL